MKISPRTVFALALAASFGITTAASAQAVRGVAELGIEKPVTKVEGTTVVTTLKIKNLSKGPISGLKVNEYWFDKAGNSAPGGTVQLRQPLAVGAVRTLTLKTPRTDKMESNSYQFTHANGTVNTKLIAKIE